VNGTETAHRTFRVVHMGDSITVGQYVDPSLRWTTLIADRLRESFTQRGLSFESHNQGVSGEQTRMGLERFPVAVQALRPAMMTLQYGLNDCNCWQSDNGAPRVSEAAFAANLIEMIVRARAFGARQIILATNHPTLRHTMMVSGEIYEEANARYSQIVRSVAAQTGITLCDIRSSFSEYTRRQLEELLQPHPDHLHLSPAGNRAYADALWPYIQRGVEHLVTDPEAVEATV
jgi:lysophospholipase L1-like esterase